MHREVGGERAVLSKTLTAVLLAVFQVPAVGTAQVPEGSDGEASDKLEEVIVTARKRTENIQNVPISVQAVGEQALVERNLDSLADLAETVPGVHIGVGARSDDLYIRGIGSGNNQSFDQSVGTFIDDIYHGRSRESTAAFLDLDRVEILKGPQSTFFGNNAIAGAFNVITRKPTSDFDGSIRALYGQDGQYAVEGAAGGPIVADKLAVRAAAIWDGMNGWLENQDGQHVPGERNEAGRLTLLFTPSDDLEATLKTEGGSNRNRGWVPYQLADCPPPAPFTAAGFCTTALRSTVPIGLDNSKTSSSVGQGTDLDTFEEVLTVAYTHWDHTFTSVTGYYSYRYNSDLDTDGLPEALFNARIPERYNQFSQEFRITSPAGKLFEYMGGLYYQRDRLSVSQRFDYFFLSPTVGSKASLAPLVPYLPLGQETDFSQPERTRAVFGSLSWNLTDRLKLSTGLRGSWVDKSIDWRLYYGTATQTYGGVVALPASVTPLAAALGLGTPGTADETRSDSAWTPSAIIQYRLDGRKMIYFSYAQGFKAGGFNGVDNTGNPASLPFAPEHVNAYEAGLKSQWLDDRLVLNLDVFRSNYRNLQVSANELTAAGTFVSVVKNAAASQTQGVELDGQWAVTRDFRLAAQAAYDDAHYVSYPNAGPTSLQQFLGLKVQNLSGAPTEFAPRWSGTLTGSYSRPLPGGFALTTKLSTLASSRYFLTGVNDPLLEEGFYVRLDGVITLEPADKRWAIDLIGKNLTDRDILVWGSGLPTSLGATVLQKEQPRNVAIQARYQW